MSKPFWKTAIKDWGVVNFLEDKVGKSLPAKVIGTIAEKVADSNPITSVVMDLITDPKQKDIPADKFSQADLAELIRVADKDQKNIEAEARLIELENAEMANARQMELERMKVGGGWQKHLNGVIALAFLILYTALIAVVIFKGLDESASEIVFLGIGTFGTAVGGVTQYYFGRTKNDEV